MEIVLLTTTYPRYPGDPIGSFILGQARALVDRGHTVKVFVPHDPDVGAPRVEPSHGVEIHRFHYWWPHRWERLCHGAGMPENWRRNRLLIAQVPTLIGGFALRALPHARQADIVHGHWSFAGLAALMLGRLTGTPTVVSMHGAEVLSPALKPLNRLLARRADGITVNSQFTYDVLTANVPNAAPQIIPFGVNAEKVAEPAISPADFKAQHGLDPADRIVLAVGRLVERKGFHVLVEAAQHVAPGLPVKVLIGGKGPEDVALQTQIDALGLADRVQLLGFIGDDELAAWYAAADVFVLPAVTDSSGDTEGLGMVLLEAIANGTPVIASEAGGITDIVQHGDTGLLVPPWDAPALGEAITRIMQDDALRAHLRAEAARHMARNFSWGAIGQRLDDLYDTVRTSA